MKRITLIQIALILCLISVACDSKWQRVEKAFKTGAPLVVNRFEAQGKLSTDEASALRKNLPLIVDDVHNRDWAAASVHLGAIARVEIKNPEARAWLDDLVAVSSLILGVDVETSGPQMRGIMAKSKPAPKAPALTDENVRRLETLTK